jgi:hypothetical protein
MPSPAPADRLRAKQPRRITVGVFLDEEPADRLDAAVLARQDGARVSAASEDLDVLDQAIKAAQAALDDATMWFTFQALGRNAFARLVASCAPTEQQIADAETNGRPRPEYNVETFGPLLLSESCVAPSGLTLDDWMGIFADEAWNEQEIGALMAAALAVNTRARPLQVRAEQ